MFWAISITDEIQALKALALQKQASSPGSSEMAI